MSTPDFSRFSAFVEHYISQLEPASGPTRRAQDKGIDLAEASVQELKGRGDGKQKLAPI